MRAGFAIANITPRERRPDLSGFAARIQPATRIAAPVSARLVLLDDGHTRAVIAVCDTLGFRQADSLRFERAIGRAADVPADNVLLACTHTHSGPMSMPLGLMGRFRPAYLKLVECRLIEAARAAVRDLQPVTGARFGTQSIRAMGEYRCCRQEPGRALWPGVVSVFQLRRAKGGAITFCHTGIHPYVLGLRSRVLHPDFPLPTCAALGERAVFLPGCGADVSPVPGMGVKLSDVARYGRKLARAAERALARGRQATVEPLRTRVVTPRIRFGFLPVLPQPSRQETKFARNHREWERALKAGRLPREAAFRMHCVRLGDLVFVGIPAEVFGQTGIDLQGMLKSERLLPISHAGGNWGYLPRPFSYKNKTYESSSAHQWYRTAGGMMPGTEETVRQVVGQAVQRLKR